MPTGNFSTDVRDRMRRYPNTAVHAPDLIREGIAEIERLRNELSARNAYESCKTLTELRQSVETLTAERDSARRMVCWSEANPEWYAEEMGWDCFKEDGK